MSFLHLAEPPILHNDLKAANVSVKFIIGSSFFPASIHAPVLTAL